MEGGRRRWREGRKGERMLLLKLQDIKTLETVGRMSQFDDFCVERRVVSTVCSCLRSNKAKSSTSVDDMKHPALPLNSAPLHNCTQVVSVLLTSCGSENFSFSEYALIS